MNTTTTPAQLVQEYITLRNQKKEYERRVEELIAERFGNRMTQLEGILLDTLNSMGIDAIKSPAGTVYKHKFESLTVENQSEWRRHVIGAELWDLLEWRPLKSAVSEVIEADGIVPPGLKFSVFTKVGVRKNT